MTRQDLERAVCAVICRGKGLRAREIAAELKLDHKTVNRVLYGSPLMKELCWQDRDFRWHGLVRQARPHAGLEEFAGWYGTAAVFATLSEAEWMAQLAKGCGALITGDVKHDVFIDAQNEGFCVIDAGHFHTENIFCEYMRAELSKQFKDVEFETAESNADVVSYCV